MLLLAAALAPGAARALDASSPEAVEQRVRYYASLYKVPPDMVLRIVHEESKFDPSARNGPYWGLMQIRFDTARGVGYAGHPAGLLDADTNLTYGVAYLANAYMVAGGNERRAHRLYQSGFYYEAKRKGLLSKLIKVPPVAQPEVMLASVIPVVTHEDVAAAVVADVVVVPIPQPKPVMDARVAMATAVERPAATPEPVTDASTATSTLADASTMPLPVPRPKPAPTLMVVASAAIPLPRPRPATFIVRSTKGDSARAN